MNVKLKYLIKIYIISGNYFLFLTSKLLSVIHILLTHINWDQFTLINTINHLTNTNL